MGLDGRRVALYGSTMLHCSRSRPPFFNNNRFAAAAKPEPRA
jgi:hypothetical protein